MKISKRKQSPLQQFICQRAEERDISRYQLAVLCGWKPASVYRKLSGPVRSNAIERMLAALKATVTVDGTSIVLYLDKGRIASTGT